MSSKIKPCTLAAKHKWEWVRDKEVKSGTFGPSGATLHISLKGIYKCACGTAKYGEPKGGF